MADQTLSNQIYLSRDQIRNQIINYAKTYLEMDQIDLTKSSFLSFIINIFATLTSNLLFYESSVYREFFLTTAQLPESVYNLSAFLGYNTREAAYATTNVLFKVPLTFTDNNVLFRIKSGQKFYANNIEFITYYITDVNVINNNSATVVVTEGSKVYNLPVAVDTTATNTFSFILPVRQYKVTTQEFQIDSDVKPFEFVTIDVPVKGKVASLSVMVRDPGSTAWQLYTEFESLYLMGSSDFGFVNRKTGTGRRLYFGNGLIGKQPAAGSTVLVTINETEGTDGNIISGSITKGERVYTTSGGSTKNVNYTVTNPSSAVGGEDEETIDEVRSNAITNITALGRLVSENDYANSNIIVPFSGMTMNPIAVLKRSDVKVNDIQLYTALVFEDIIVPTRNEFASLIYGITNLPRGSIVHDQDNFSYYTLFDMTFDYTNNEAYYHYVAKTLEKMVTLSTTYISTYDIFADKISVVRSGLAATYTLSYGSTEPDFDLATCTMELLETGETFVMTNDPTTKTFTYTFADYRNIKDEEVTYFFTLSNTVGQVATYTASFTFRKDLQDFMMSSFAADGTSIVVYDIPVIEKSYYDAINQETFELNVMQNMIDNFKSHLYRMLTDFVNLKFVNTFGRMTNMQYNKVTKLPVINSGLTAVPPHPKIGDKYIVSGLEGGAWSGHKNELTTCSFADGTNITWIFVEPVTNDIVYVTGRKTKLLFTGFNWIVPEFTVPLIVDVEVFKQSTFTGSDTDLANTVRSTILEGFATRFGANASLFRSEIISVIQQVSGVDHCNLIAPISDIFFNFELQDLTQSQLLVYTPEYVYFSSFEINVKVLSS